MAEYFAAFADYWYMTAFLVLLIIIMPFVCVKAAKASKKRHALVNALYEKAKHESELRKEFSLLTEELVSSAKSDTLFAGVALNLEALIQKSEDADAEYSKMSVGQRYVYSLHYLLQDAEGGKLSDFFRSSGKPLTEDAKNATAAIFGGRVQELVETEYNMFDEDNEECSVIDSELSPLDNEFAELTLVEKPHETVGRYIKENIKQFIN